MNYLDLINKCLIELNYKTVNSFEELVKNDHRKIKNILNNINVEVCSSYNWDFLLNTITINLPKGFGDIDNPIEGKILDLIIDKTKYSYDVNFENFFTNTQQNDTYSTFNGKILLPQFSEDKTIQIIYLTDKYAIDKDKNKKANMDLFDDFTVIPQAFAEPILIYGTCMRLKGNPQHIRFNYWLSMYKNALSNLIAYSKSTKDDVPHIKMERN
ncbi:MAG: hypothetical protein LKG27_05585 [Clostridiaceae bacterium]|nr:hypothetical protein [Clostridiaceae bacterium]